MTDESFTYIADVLKGQLPQSSPDWYEILGFLSCHKIEGLFYKRTQKLCINLPQKVEQILQNTYLRQKRKVEFMREHIRALASALYAEKTEHAFLKGSVLSHGTFGGKEMYSDGERVSNDVDILVKWKDISAVGGILNELGYIQGKYNRTTHAIDSYSRVEIVRRQMNRGETAPFVKLTDNKEFPFMEVDINFSLGNTPNERNDLLSAMLDSAEIIRGKVVLQTLSREMFFLHLIMHQYKESCLYFMVLRSKDLDLYKLADIYYMIKSELLDFAVIGALTEKFNIEKAVGAVLHQVGEVFDDGAIVAWAKRYPHAQPQVIDYDCKKKYIWTVPVCERLKTSDSQKYLAEV